MHSTVNLCPGNGLVITRHLGKRAVKGKGSSVFVLFLSEGNFEFFCRLQSITVLGLNGSY
jgi:hypothetical protein